MEDGKDTEGYIALIIFYVMPSWWMVLCHVAVTTYLLISVAFVFFIILFIYLVFFIQLIFI